MTADHPLDRPAWHALTGRQAAFALAEPTDEPALALRFTSEVASFVAAVDRSDAAMAAVARMVRSCGGGLSMVEDGAVPVPPGLIARYRASCYQMVADTVTGDMPDLAFEPLAAADGAEMLALATLTKPGPFYAETWRLGSFIGVKRDGRLIAMAGERMKPGDFTEVSGVCTLPEYRGQGLAGALMRVVARRILDRGERPFLHVYSSNIGAIGLYETLGFRKRRVMWQTILDASPVPAPLADTTRPARRAG